MKKKEKKKRYWEEVMEKRKATNSTVLEVCTLGTLHIELTGTELCHETASSNRIHFPAHHSSCNGINSACNPCPNRKVLSGPISAYLKD